MGRTRIRTGNALSKRELAGAIIILGLVFGLGFLFGWVKGVEWCINIATQVLDIKLDPVLLQDLISKYGDNVKVLARYAG